MTARVGFFALVMACIACGRNDSAAPPRGATRSNVNAPPAPADDRGPVVSIRPRPTAVRGGDPFQPSRPDRRQVLVQRSPEPLEVKETKTTLLAPRADRDYSAELRGLIGDARSCVTEEWFKNAPPQTVIDLETVVSDQGVITRSTVRSSSLDVSAVECIRRRLSVGRFRPPVEAAPRTVRAQIHLQTVSVPAQP